MVKTKKKTSGGVKPKSCKNKRAITEISQVAEFLKLISEENRLKILYLLEEDEKCVCDIWQRLGLAQNLASYHLKSLENLGLISSERKALKVIYSINEKGIKKYSKLLNKFLKLKS